MPDGKAILVCDRCDIRVVVCDPCASGSHMCPRGNRSGSGPGQRRLIPKEKKEGSK
jgi:hypothetical protein